MFHENQLSLRSMAMMATRIVGVVLTVQLGACGFGVTGSTAPDFGGDPFPGPDAGVPTNRDGFSNPNPDGFFNPDGSSSNNICDVTLRTCPLEMSYTGTGNEVRVEIRGSFTSETWNTGYPMTKNGATWVATVPVPWNVQVEYKIFVVNPDNSERWLSDPNNPNGVPDGFGGTNSIIAPSTCTNWTCQQSTPSSQCTPQSGTFDWRDAVMYFVFVDRFFDGDPLNNEPSPDPLVQTPANWQGGDWAGVTAKINEGYFDSLGVNALWLTVPMDNSASTGLGADGYSYTGYHGYWPRDLNQPEAHFGTMNELKTLVDAAHSRGIKVIIDYAMNHVHTDSPVFQEHQNDGWFNPLMVRGQECVCGSGVCPWDGPTGKVCWFRNYLADFNFNNVDARNYSLDNILMWIKTTGADGFRLDAIKHVELEWLTELRTRLNTEVESVTGEHVYLVGETFSGDRNFIRSFVNPCTMLDGQFDFPLRAVLNGVVLERQGTMNDLIGFLDTNTTYYGTSAVMSTFIGNHDVPRVIHFAQDTPLWQNVWDGGGDRKWSNQPPIVSGTSAYERVALAMAVLMTNRGIPLIYYGDEVGLPGAGDPDNRRFMQWGNYTTGQQLLLDRMKKLGELRKQHSALRRGDRTTITSDNDTWVYRMVDGNDTVYVAMNRSDTARALGGLPSGGLRDEVNGESLNGPSVSVPARSFRIMIAQ